MAIFSVALTGKECELTNTEEARCSVLFFFPFEMQAQDEICSDETDWAGSRVSI